MSYLDVSIFLQQLNYFDINFLNSYSIIPLKIFQPGGSEGDIENGGDLEESDIEYDEQVEGNGGRKTARARHPSRRRGLSNRSGASHPDRYRYISSFYLNVLVQQG